MLADGWNDTMDIFSGFTALVGVVLSHYSPERFLTADRVAAAAIGLIIAGIGVRVVRDATLDLMDTMPPQELIEAVRKEAEKVPGVLGTEKIWARKTGLRYHIDLHLEVDPFLSVAEGHGIAEEVRNRIRQKLADIADVLVHVEPHWPKAVERVRLTPQSQLKWKMKH